MMKFDDKSFLAEQIKQYRKKAGLTQAELAEKVDLSTQHISRIESACYVPSLKTFFLIVDILKMDLALFGFNLQQTTNPTKKELIQVIAEASDTELVFYKNTIDAIKNSLNSV